MRIKSIDVLKLVAENMPANAIAIQLGITKGTVSEHIQRLTDKGLIVLQANSRPRFYSITQAGSETLTKSAMGNTNTNLSSKLTSRLHALEVHYLLFRTEYSKLEAKLSAKGIIYEKSGNMASPQLTIHLSPEMTLKFTTRKLIAWGPQIEKPINAETQEILDQGLSKNMATINDFVAELGIKCQRGLDGSLIGRIRYYEIAITNSELANKISHKEKTSFIALAWDRITKRASIWLDNSETWELEGNKLKSYEPVRKWAQAIEDSKLDPYQEVIETRQLLAEIVTNIGRQTEVNTQQIGQLAEQLNVHAPYLNAWQKVAEAISSPSGRRKAMKAIEELDSRQTRLTR